ncbi:response regulator [Eubacterium oxidoreducens]|uniref:Stage 0 sporulation protein A homolog n=1 Tax=Eubacterium oxidoreducens TaxID=1732 RepID=A0A1G6CAG7_EUBOX|nr:response regulator [Eubacterium oxidoreducens]SDB29811.1 Response regulator receiver domain-containing protein [Eubacterium oxidoreducens]
MTIIALADKLPELERLIQMIEAESPQAEVWGFSQTKSARECIERVGCDVLFVDVILQDASGLEFAKEIMELNPEVNVIFTAESTSFANAAFQLYASGYITKPLTPQKVAKELHELRYTKISESV